MTTQEYIKKLKQVEEELNAVAYVLQKLQEEIYIMRCEMIEQEEHDIIAVVE